MRRGLFLECTSIARRDALCNSVQRMLRNTTSVGIGRPWTETADPEIPGSAVIKL